MLRRICVALAAAAVVVPAAPSVATGGTPPAFGAHVHAMWDYGDIVAEPTALAQSLDALADAGASWVRYDIGWATLEYLGKGDRQPWYVNRFETALRLANSRGLQVLTVVWCTPWWAAGISHEVWAEDPDGVDDAACSMRPTNADDYADVMRWLSASYSNPSDPLLRVAAWELWNEPDHPRFWYSSESRAQRARDYVERVLIPGHRGAKEGSGEAVTVLGAPTSSSAWMLDGSPMGGDKYWLNLVYASGAAGHFDVMGTHPYVQTSSVENLEPEYGGDPGWGHLTIENTGQVRELMHYYGDDEKPIWYTELGWSAHPNTPLGGELPQNWELGVTEEQQADYLVRALELVEANPAWGVEVAIWYNDRDRGDDPSTNDGRQIAAYGLLRRSGAPKAAISLLGDRLAECSSVAVAAPGVIVGTPFDDVLCGTSGDDLIIGLGGDDIILGLGGDDRIRAGDGDDTVWGSPGDDEILGGIGADQLYGGLGSDLIDALGDGPDIVSGGWPRTDTCLAAADDVVWSCP